MPLDQPSQSPPVRKSQSPSKHTCAMSSPCAILLSEVGKRYHTFPKGTFHAKFTPPAIPCSVL